MVITDPLVLPDDVALLSSEELPDEVRRQAGCEPGEVVLTRRRVRASSVVVGPDTAAVLALFRTPQTIVDAVLAYSRTNEADPEKTLDSVYPALQRLLEASLLVPAAAADRIRINPTLAAGAAVHDWEVVRCVQLLDDVEVYQVRAAGPAYAALKLLRPGASPVASELLAAEAAVLPRLAGGPVPPLLQHAEHEGRPLLVTGWCAGVPADRYAGELRQQPDGAGPAGLLQLCQAVAEAYAAVHDRGVVHGDVHPRNVLVAADGTVTLIDFGLAHITSDAAFRVAGRGGVGFLLEPELAAARLAGRPPPPPSAAGEQYALAALLYLLVTGGHYLAFQLDERQAMAQIASDPPVPFRERECPPWPELERVLATALAKRPEDRYASVAELAAQLRKVGPPEPAGRSRRAPDRAGTELVTGVLNRLDLAGPLLAGAGPVPPRSSVTYGAGGIGYALYRIAARRGDPRLLSLADVWAQRAVRPPDAGDDWLNKAVGVTRERVGEISPYHRLPGVHLVRAMIAHAIGNQPLRQAAVDGFLAGSAASCDVIDVTLGRSGTLLACALLHDCLSAGGGHDELAAVTAHGTATAADLLARIAEYGPVHDCPDLDYLGAAHGWAGVLYALLTWCQVTGAPVPDAIPDRLDQLAALAQPAGRGVWWPVRTGLPDPAASIMPGWCNGSAGQIHLWATAHETFRDGRYLPLAEAAGWHTWEEPGGGASLCCGLAGRAYGLLRLYRHTGEPAWLARSRKLAAAAAAGTQEGTFPDSLYKGQVGIALVTEELRDPATAAMPLFEPERWPHT